MPCISVLDVGSDSVVLRFKTFEIWTIIIILKCGVDSIPDMEEPVYGIYANLAS